MCLTSHYTQSSCSGTMQVFKHGPAFSHQHHRVPFLQCTLTRPYLLYKKTLEHSNNKSPQISYVYVKNELVQERSSKQAAIQPPFWSQPPISLKSLKNWQLAISIKTLKAAGITNIKILLFTTLQYFLFENFYLIP